MRSEFENCLSIAEYARLVGLNPWTLAQFGCMYTNPAGQAVSFGDCCSEGCDAPYFEYMWNREKLARDEISRAIQQAELMISTQLGYWVCPKQFTEEWNFNPQTYDNACGNGLYNHCGEPYPHNLPWAHLQQTGTQVLTLIDTVGVNRASTRPPVELLDTFTSDPFPIPDDTTVDQICAFFTEADRLGEPLLQWQIRPFNVTIDSSGGTGNWTAIISGGAYLLVVPALYLAQQPEALCADEDDNYVIEIDIYLKTVDRTAQGDLIWCDCCEESTQPACFTIYNRESGIIGANGATLNDDDPPILICDGATRCTCGRGATHPCKIRAHYIAGYPLQPNGQMDVHHALEVAHLATTLLQCNFCKCGCLGDLDHHGTPRHKLFHWREVPVYESGMTGFKLISQKKQDANLFGEERAAEWAWQFVESHKFYKSIVLDF